MFKNYTSKEISSQNKAKSSVARKIREDFVSTYPLVEEVIDELWGKKDDVILCKTKAKVSFLVVNGEVLLFQRNQDDLWFPSLKTLHRYPWIMPKFRVDKGATKFIIKGAKVMAPGLTSVGGRMEDVDEGRPVQIVCEGRDSACGVGVTIMSSEDIKKKNAGDAVESLHVLGDGLWQCGTV